MDNSIVLKTESGEEVTFYAEEETKMGGVSYILVSDSDKDSANAYILKDISKSGEIEANYVMVEDNKEFDAVAALFAKMLDDADLVREDTEGEIEKRI